MHYSINEAASPKATHTTQKRYLEKATSESTKLKSIGHVDIGISQLLKVFDTKGFKAGAGYTKKEPLRSRKWRRDLRTNAKNDLHSNLIQ